MESVPIRALVIMFRNYPMAVVPLTDEVIDDLYQEALRKALIAIAEYELGVDAKNEAIVVLRLPTLDDITKRIMNEGGDMILEYEVFDEEYNISFPLMRVTLTMTKLYT